MIRPLRLALLLLAAGLPVVLTGCPPPQHPPPKPLASAAMFGPCGEIATLDEPLPDVAFPTLDGRTLRLSELQGKVVMLDFWAMLCSGCVDGLNGYQAHPEVLSNPQVQLLTVTVDQSESAVRKFVAEKGWTFPVVMATDEIRQAFLKDREIVLPQGRLVGPDGHLRYRLDMEQMDLKTLRCLWEGLLGSVPAAG